METKRNISKTFVGFLIASLLIWVLINLSKEYTSVVSYAISYQGLAQNKLLQENPPETINLLLKGSGFRLFSESFSNKKILLDAGKLRKKTKTDFYLLPNNQKIEIQNQLYSGLQFLEVLEDTIRLKIGNLATKKVPVIPKISMQFHPGYGLLENITTQPDSIDVSGPEIQLNKIKSIEVKDLKLENITSNFTQEVNLQLPDNLENTRFSHKKVTLIGKVDKFTEGNFELPFLIKNVPVGVVINTFPKTVKVTYKVGLQHFNSVTANLFSVACDYKQAKENEVSYLVPKVVSKPNVVSAVKIEPNKVDFLIHK